MEDDEKSTLRTERKGIEVPTLERRISTVCKANFPPEVPVLGLAEFDGL